MNARTTTTLASLLALASVAGLSGCRGDREEKPPRQFFPDMDDMPRWKPQAKSDFYADGRTMRQPVKGTVPFARVGMGPGAFNSRPESLSAFFAQRDDLYREDPAFFTGRSPDGSYVATMPVAPDKAMLALGREKFNITCSACHGYLGDGKGMVGLQWSYALPSFHDAKYKVVDPSDATSIKHHDGFLFYTARYGVPNPANPDNPKMPGYAHSLSEREAWAVVSYIRALQKSQDGTAGDVPDAVRAEIDAKRPRTTPATGGQP